MTKAQLVTKLAEAGGVSRKQADQILDNLIETVVKSVKKGESVKIPGLGIFRLRKMKARMGRNPQTGEPIKIPARKKVGFSVAKMFKEIGAREGQVRPPNSRGRSVRRSSPQPRAPARPSPAGASGGARPMGRGFRMIRQATLLAVAFGALSGCATFVHGPYQDVTDRLEPARRQGDRVGAGLGARSWLRRQGEAGRHHARDRAFATRQHVSRRGPEGRLQDRLEPGRERVRLVPSRCLRSPCDAIGALPTYDMSERSLAVRFAQAAFYEYPVGMFRAFGKALRIFSPEALLGNAFKLKARTPATGTIGPGPVFPRVTTTLEPIS